MHVWKLLIFKLFSWNDGDKNQIKEDLGSEGYRYEREVHKRNTVIGIMCNTLS